MWSKAMARVLMILLLPAMLAWAADPPQADIIYDCTQTRIDEVGDALLTKDERLKQMDHALYESIDRYESCMRKQMQTLAEAQGQSGGGNAGDTVSQGQHSSDGAQQQVQQAQTEPKPLPQVKPGKKPDKAKEQAIAPKDNDSILCKQVWEAMSQEQDQEKKQKLLEIYKNYGCGK
ncbi:hypothetical protein [Bowmanella denitrificans]|uniref:hypothetical protein n=1 Tax=Bowmanella denitrificans TaxID=366582 RepID=UPI000C9B6926|nr:hypothetical protein [Bowmanella denitrificans]